MKKQPTDRQQTGAETEPTNPFTGLNDTVLAAVAQEVGLSLDNLKIYLNEPHVDMTCPLCGKAHNRLVICQGCGRQAWRVAEAAATTDEPAIGLLRNGLTATLKTAAHAPEANWSAEQIGQAVRHAYQPGGCRLCQECWETMISAADHRLCPLYLHADHMVAMHEIETAYVQPALDGPEAPTSAWIATLFTQWLQFSSATAQTVAELKSTVGWRRAILNSALHNA